MCTGIWTERCTMMCTKICTARRTDVGCDVHCALMRCAVRSAVRYALECALHCGVCCGVYRGVRCAVHPRVRCDVHWGVLWGVFQRSSGLQPPQHEQRGLEAVRVIFWMPRFIWSILNVDPNQVSSERQLKMHSNVGWPRNLCRQPCHYSVY